MFQKLNVLDEHFDLQKQNVVELFRGPSDIAINPYQVVGGTPNSNYGQFNIALTPGAWLDPKAFIDYKFTVNVILTAPVGGIPIGGGTPTVFDVRTDMSLTDYPFQTGGICGVCDIQLNTKQVNSIDMNRYGKILLELFRKKKDNNYAPGPSLAEDFYAKLDDSYLTVANSAASVYDASTDRIPNGSWSNMTIGTPVFVVADTGATFAVNNFGQSVQIATNNWAAGTTCTLPITVTGREALIIPPFVFGAHKEQAMFGINNLNINLNYSQATVFRAFRSFLNSRQTGGALIGPASNLNILALSLTLKTYQTPNMPGFNIPYPNYIKPSYQFYTNIVKSTNAFPGPAIGADGAISPLVVNNIIMSNVVSSGMPRAIMLWCDKNNESYGQNYMKYYYPINGVNIGIGSKQNLLATFKTGDLYELGREAGLKRNYLAYSGTAQNVGNNGANVVSTVQLVGSPLMLIPGLSFPLGEDITTNSDGTYTFTFNVNCQNTVSSYYNTAAPPVLVNPETGVYPNLNVMLIYDAWVMVDMQNLNVEVVRNPLSRQAPAAPAKLVSDQQVHGDLETGGAMLHRPNMYDHKMGSHQQSKLFNRIRK